MRKHYLTCIVLFSIFQLNAQFYGPNDFRISDAGGSGSILPTTENPDLAYNSVTQQFLVVWQSDDTDQPGVVDFNTQIIGRFIDLNGTVIGEDFLISKINLGNAARENQLPRVAYNTADNNFMVVYECYPSAGEAEIFAVILDQNGAVIKPDFRISREGADNNSNTDARSPGIAYNPALNEFLIVHVLVVQSTSTTAGIVEIRGRRINGSGVLIGDTFDITDSTNGTQTNGSSPDVIFNGTTNQYAVTYQASPLPNEEEAYSTLVNQDGTIGVTTRLSNRGFIDDRSFGFKLVRAAHSATDNVYLFVYDADNSTAGEIDIFGVIYDNAMNLLVPEFEISQVANNSTTNDASSAHVAWLPSNNTFHVVFRANPFFNNRNEIEIFMRTVTTNGTVGSSLLQVSSAPIDEQGISFSPRIASNGNAALLTAYRAGDTSPQNMMVSREYEIFGQLYGDPTLSIEEETLSGISIYPNPSSDKISLLGNLTNHKEITVLNGLGQKVAQMQNENATDLTIDINSLSTGLYFLQISTSDNFRTLKFIKK